MAITFSALGGGSGGSTSLANSQWDYDPVTRTISTEATIKSGLNSFQLGNHFVISAGGRTIYFRDNTNDLTYFPSAGAFKDQSVVANQGDDGVIQPRVSIPTSDLVLFSNSTPAASGSIIAEYTYVNTVHGVMFGTSFIVEEPIQPSDVIVHVFHEGSESGNRVFSSDVTGLTHSVGDTVSWYYEHPCEGYAGDVVYESHRIWPNGDKNQERKLLIRVSDGDATLPYRSQLIRVLQDYDVIHEGNVPFNSIVGGNFVDVDVVGQEATISLGFRSLSPTFVAQGASPDITFGGFASVGVIRKRDLTTGEDTFFQSSTPTPVTNFSLWSDWVARETLAYT